MRNTCIVNGFLTSRGDQHFDLHLRAIVMKETELVELTDTPVPNSPVVPGQLYTFSYNFNVPYQPSGVSYDDFICVNYRYTFHIYIKLWNQNIYIIVF